MCERQLLYILYFTDVYKDCHAAKVANMVGSPPKDGVYAIDPDGAGGVELFAVTCDFKTVPSIGITEVCLVNFCI